MSKELLTCQFTEPAIQDWNSKPGNLDSEPRISESSKRLC